MWEGTAAHALAEWALRGNNPLPVDNVEVERQNGAWEIIPVDDEMRDGVEVFVSAVQKTWASLEEPKLQIEQEFSLAPLGPPEQMWGSADAVVTGRHGGKRFIRVFDLKYGQGFVVEVLENEQLQTYVVGAILQAALDNDDQALWQAAEANGLSTLDVGLSMFDEISITIIQPRAPHSDGPVRTVELTHEQVESFARSLIDKARATQERDAPLTPGTWCKFCPAKGHCPALQAAAQEAAQVAFDVVPVGELQDALPVPEQLPIEVVAEMVGKLPILEEWARAMRARIENELNQGHKVPGFKLVMKRGKRVWAFEDKQTVRFLEKMGLQEEDIYREPELKSPAQLEKVVGRRHLPEEMMVMQSSGTIVAPDSDARPAVVSSAQDVFPALLPGETTNDDTT